MYVVAPGRWCSIAQIAIWKYQFFKAENYEESVTD